MPHDLQLAYLGIETPDPASLDGFFGDVIGLIPGSDTGAGKRTWRNDDRAQRIVVRPGPAEDAVFVGFEVPDDATLDRVADRLRRIGCAVAEGGDADRADRRVDRLVRTRAPWGVDIEVVTGLAAADQPYASPLVPGGFLTDGVGFGHAVFVTTAFDESRAFLTDGLGFEHSDWLEMDLGSDLTLEVHFYHCNPRHHTVALARAPFDLPQTLHHVMVETNARDDVGAAFDRAWATDLPIPNGLGRHDNDGMFSFYVASPAGWLVEVGHGARVIPEHWDDDRRYDRISAWGHQALRS